MTTSTISTLRALKLCCLPMLLAACMPPSLELAGPEPVDYARAESFLAPNTAPLVMRRIEALYWQEDDQLVFRTRHDPFGLAYVQVNPTENFQLILLDTERLAAAFSAQDDTEQSDATQYTSDDMELFQIELDGESAVRFRFEGNNYHLDLDTYELNRLQASNANEFASPDGSQAAFIQDHNLWLRDTTTNALTQLTFDGEEHYGYGTNNAGWLRDEGPVLLWSPNSRSIATFRHDSRQVEEMYLYDTRVGHPNLDAWKYPLPGDDHIFMIERIVIHLGSASTPEPTIVRLDIPPDPHRSTTADHVADFDGTFLDVQWNADGSQLAFISSSRDHKVAQLRIADANTGTVRDVLREEAATYYESGFNQQNWYVLWQRNEFIWFSERDNWGHLYLYDLTSGELKRQLTSGNWPVLQLQQVDAENGQIYFTAATDDGTDPYYHYLYQLALDGGEPQLLTPQPAHHTISWSPSGQYFVDSWSTPTQPGASVLHQRSSQPPSANSTNAAQPTRCCNPEWPGWLLEETDISALLNNGWVPPVPFTVKARDQLTDLHGLMYRPSNFNPDQSYPVLNYLYPGPQSGSVGSRSFRPSRGDKQAIAELGFIVVELDAMGTPGRSKSFHDAYYGNMGDNGLPDQVSAIRQLAAERPWMDLERVGIWGHSGGGFASTAGILRYPEFYKVAVSSAGNHDNRNYEDDWAEKWQGLLITHPETNPDATNNTTQTRTNYDNQANQLLANELQGKLLLAHGMLDDNVHPSSTLLMVDALIDAEKEFDLVILPSSRHGFANSRYFMLKRWNYFVEHLMGATPDSQFRFADNIR